MFYRELIYQAVIFLVIKPMVLKKSELTLPSKMQNTPFRQGKTFLTRGIVIIGCIRNVIWSSAFSIKSKLFAELLLVMISLLHRFLLSYTSLPFGFCLNNTTLLSFQIRSSINSFSENTQSIFSENTVFTLSLCRSSSCTSCRFRRGRDRFCRPSLHGGVRSDSCRRPGSP